MRDHGTKVVDDDVAREEAARDFSAWLEALLRKVPRRPVLPDVVDRASFYDAHEARQEP
jgi:hypothetical protein